MKKKHSKFFPLTCCAILSALATVSMTVSTVIPTMKMAFIAVTMFLLCAETFEFGRKYGIIGSVVTVLLTILFSPNKFAAFGYSMLFTTYPIVKSFLEIPENKTVRIIIKTAYFAVLSAASAIALKLFNIDFTWITVLIIFIALILTEILLNFFIAFYKDSIHPHLHI